MRRLSLFGSSLGVAVVAALVVGSSSCLLRDPDHCAHQGEPRGHEWCAARNPAFPLCSRCEPSDNGHSGCTDDREEPLRCLVDETDPLGESETSASSGATAATGATVGSSGDAVACAREGLDPACEALDPELAFCREGECAACADELCTAPGSASPSCAPGGRACVGCWPEQGLPESGCAEATPHCDPQLQCAATCSFHEHCGPHRACDLQTGTCIEPLLWVDATVLSCQPPTDPKDPPTGSVLRPFCSLAQAVAAVGAGEAAVLRFAELGPHVEPGPVVVAEGKRIALMAAIGAARPGDAEIRAGHGEIMLEVRDGGALYPRGVELSREASSNEPGVSCEGGRVWLDDVDLHGHGPGMQVLACDVLVRRSKIHSNIFDGIWTPPVDGPPDTSTVVVEASALTNNGADGIDFDGATLRVAYSTLVDNFNQNVRCRGGDAVVRNSILLGPLAGDGSDPEPAITCDASVYAEGHNVTNADFPFDIGGAFTDWFQDHLVGDVRIREGSSPFEGVGRWSLGEPPFDIEGRLRPTGDAVVDGEVITFVGAHEP